MKEEPIDLFFVFCLAGLGERFTKAGINKPKYLLSYQDKETILEKSLRSLNFGGKNKVIFCCNKKFIGYEPTLKEILIRSGLNFDLLYYENTNGQAHTALLASRHIEMSYPYEFSNMPIAFFNGDTILKKRNINDLSKKMSNSSGLIDCFLSEDKGYSFIRKGRNDNVVQIEEKKNISKLATTGLYFFSNTETYITGYNDFDHEQISSEIYISNVYKNMIKNNMEIKYHLEEDPKNTIVLGTPEQYKNYLQLKIKSS